MWDVQLQRRAVMNEMRQMAARPFASVEMQLNPENKLLTVEQPSPVSITVAKISRPKVPHEIA